STYSLRLSPPGGTDLGDAVCQIAGRTQCPEEGRIREDAIVEDLAQFITSGLTRGSIYALVGMGFAIIFNASNLINFAQGEFVMLGGMLTALLVTTTGLLPTWAAVPVAIIASALIGAGLYRLTIRPARRAGLA